MTKSKAMLIDITLCVGCNSCQEACKTTNKLAAGEEKTLSSTAYTALEEHDGVFVRRMCQHCIDPTCASVCPVGAFEKTPEGPVLYDENKCIGCRYCMQACPFQVPSYEWSSRLPRMRKCDMCFKRQSEGQQTACAQACPVGATINGDRDELVREARKRLAEKPDQYYGKIYGLTEVGGTSVLYLSAVPFEQIGLRMNVPQEAMPEYTWRVLELVPDVVSTGTVLLGGIYWITNRRAEVAKKEGKR
jgi:formate dehydrogenase iron-sulfur subunit